MHSARARSGGVRVSSGVLGGGLGRGEGEREAGADRAVLRLVKPGSHRTPQVRPHLLLRPQSCGAAGRAAGPQLVEPAGGKAESPPHELLVSAGSAWGPPRPAGRRGAQGQGSAANPLGGGPEGGGQGASGGATLGRPAPRTHSKRKRGPSGARSWSARRCPRGGGLGSPRGRAPALAEIQGPSPRPRPSASSRAPPAPPSPGRRSACARSAAR